MDHRRSVKRRHERRKVLILALAAVCLHHQGSDRKPAVKRKRLDWDVHKETLIAEGEFVQYYRMSAASFEKLLRAVAPFLARNTKQSVRRTGIAPITAPNMLQMTISWLVGGSYHHIRAIAGVSRTAFYDSVKHVMDILCDLESLRITAPFDSAQDVQRAANEFCAISSNSILTGCVGCVDGWLCASRARVCERSS